MASDSVISTIYRRDLFKGTVTIVTGGGTGIGYRIAREIAHLGGRVVLASRKKVQLDAAVNELKKEGLGDRAQAIPCNIRDRNDVRNCIAQVIKECGRIDYLVNNAGGQFPSFAESISPNGWAAVIDLNLTSPFFVAQEVFNTHFKDQKRGVIVNVIANMFNGFPTMSHTGAARAGELDL
tara:strand:+ start:970 stop:1509 length:540 start_codon:yes stop_codon:yes gene_type:complete